MRRVLDICLLQRLVEHHIINDKENRQGSVMKLAFWICVGIAIFGGELVFKRRKKDGHKKDKNDH